MFARRAEFIIPVKDKVMGYDLEAGDWVAPWRAGRQVDIEFQVAGDAIDLDHYHGSIVITFPGSGNGYSTVDRDTSGSQLRVAYSAPSDGYATKKAIESDSVQESKPLTDLTRRAAQVGTEDYFFRIRTELDGQGKVIHALYGKIHGPMRFWLGGGGRGKTSKISFTYYLNPDGTQNVEFDPKTNSFKAKDRYDNSVFVTAP